MVSPFLVVYIRQIGFLSQSNLHGLSFVEEGSPSNNEAIVTTSSICSSPIRMICFNPSTCSFRFNPWSMLKLSHTRKDAEVSFNCSWSLSVFVKQLTGSMVPPNSHTAKHTWTKIYKIFAMYQLWWTHQPVLDIVARPHANHWTICNSDLGQVCRHIANVATTVSKVFTSSWGLIFQPKSGWNTRVQIKINDVRYNTFLDYEKPNLTEWDERMAVLEFLSLFSTPKIYSSRGLRSIPDKMLKYS